MCSILQGIILRPSGVFIVPPVSLSRQRSIGGVTPNRDGELVRSDETISTLRIKEQSQEVVQNDIVFYPSRYRKSLKLTTTFFPIQLGKVPMPVYWERWKAVSIMLKAGCCFEPRW